MCPFGGPDQLIEFYLDCGTVTILRILDKEDHKKRDDGRAGIDNQLPCITKSEEGSRHAPRYYGREGPHKSEGMPHRDS